ncbi:hypothetical protein GOODEAATRI_013782 [Goodea atripinnis]|uniref:Uncharacterized protein n=1 Tax=Goodea atripinnis TaxID=208336 RepID=A0ABV0NUA4_9TELE
MMLQLFFKTKLKETLMSDKNVCIYGQIPFHSPPHSSIHSFYIVVFLHSHPNQFYYIKTKVKKCKMKGILKCFITFVWLHLRRRACFMLKQTGQCMEHLLREKPENTAP